jgi:hypothetical protein
LKVVRREMERKEAQRERKAAWVWAWLAETVEREWWGVVDIVFGVGLREGLRVAGRMLRRRCIIVEKWRIVCKLYKLYK